MKGTPLCLINALGKALEHLLTARLNEETERKAPLSERQFGFRKKRTIISVKKIAEAINKGPYKRRGLCALVTLDVENAFNTATMTAS